MEKVAMANPVGRPGNIGGVFAGNHADLALTGNVNETTLWSVTIPGGTLGPNGIIRITHLWNFTNSVNNKVCRLYFGAMKVAEAYFTTQSVWHQQHVVRNRNTPLAQISSMQAIQTPYGPASSMAAITVGAENTNNDIILSATGKLYSAGEQITLNDIFVEVLR